MRLRFSLAFVALLLLIAAYFAVALSWSYSSGERAGWVQKLSKKGWVCKTWEGELALVTMPGTVAVEKFEFTVHNEAVAEKINQLMGRRVALKYEQKVGLPTSCFGDTRYFVVDVFEAGELNVAPTLAPLPAAPAAVAGSAASR